MEASGELHAPAALTPGKNATSLNSRLGGPQGRPERFARVRIRTSYHPACSLATTDYAIPAPHFVYSRVYVKNGFISF